MKTRLLSLAVLLLAGAAQGALAQDGRPGGDDGRGGTHGQAGPARGAAGIPAAPAGGRGPQQGHAPQAGPGAQPGQAPHAPPPGAEGASGQPAWRGGERGGPRPGFGGQPTGQPNGQPGGQPGGRPGGAPWADGRRPEGGRPPASPPQEWSRQPGGDGWRQRRLEDQGRRPDEDRGPPAQAEDRGPPGPRGGGRPDYSPGPSGFEDRGPDQRREPDWERGRAEARPWAPHAYPPTYRSEQRYHGPQWRPPRGYYYRAWRYGEILPYGWYGRDYWIDWEDFELPEPPPGYDWVRVGADALLVEEGSGRIFQVVRAVFW